MSKNNNLDLVPYETIENKIFLIRGKKVMMDRHLAELYGVETKVLNRAVRRNSARFPADFMFQMGKAEVEIWKFHFGTSNREKMGLRKQPLVFTEQGVAMLSSVLNSQRAIQVNIQIIRTFTKLREMLASNRELREKIEKLEQKYDTKFKKIFEVIKRLVTEEQQPKQRIGFRDK